MGWLGSWNYRKSHAINGATDAGTGYQVCIKVYYGSGTDGTELVDETIAGKVYCNSHCNSDFSDIRFTDNDETTELKYWLQEKVDNSYAIFRVKVNDDLSSGTVTIYIYYGKDDALTTSDGDNTFIFFDHFPGDSLDLTKWIVREGNVTVSNSDLILTGTTETRGRIDSLISFNPNSAIHACSKINSWGHLQQLISARNGTAFTDDLMIYTFSTSKRCRGEKNNSPFEVTISLPQGTYNKYSILWTSISKFYMDEILLATISSTYTPTVSLNYYYRESNSVGSDVNVDWVFVRKYVDPEPNHGTWGNEEYSIIEITLHEALAIQAKFEIQTVLRMGAKITIQLIQNLKQKIRTILKKTKVYLTEKK